MKYIAIVILSIGTACSGTSKKGYDPLSSFPVNAEWEFLSGLGDDRIIMMLKRTGENNFNYRIELMKDYYGFPLENGSVEVIKIEQDSSVSLEGGSESCKIKLRMFQSKLHSAGKRIIVERICNDAAMNISGSDFQPLWRRGEAH